MLKRLMCWMFGHAWSVRKVSYRSADNGRYAARQMAECTDCGHIAWAEDVISATRPLEATP